MNYPLLLTCLLISVSAVSVVYAEIKKRKLKKFLLVIKRMELATIKGLSNEYSLMNQNSFISENTSLMKSIGRVYANLLVSYLQAEDTLLASKVQCFFEYLYYFPNSFIPRSIYLQFASLIEADPSKLFLDIKQFHSIIDELAKEDKWEYGSFYLDTRDRYIDVFNKIIAEQLESVTMKKAEEYLVTLNVLHYVTAENRAYAQAIRSTLTKLQNSPVTSAELVLSKVATA